MIAAAEYATGRRDQPPYELELYWQFKQWGAGDVLNIPAGVLRRVTECGNVYAACTRWHTRELGKDAEWKRQNTDAWRIVSEVKKWLSYKL